MIFSQNVGMGCLHVEGCSGSYPVSNSVKHILVMQTLIILIELLRQAVGELRIPLNTAL